MTKSIFRQQVIDEQKESLWGEVLLVQPISFTLLLGVIMLIVFSIITYLMLGTYARKQATFGVLQPSEGVFRIYSPKLGVVRKIMVVEGDEVSEGDALFLINGDQILKTGESLEAAMLEEYQKQFEILSKQFDDLPSRYDLEGIKIDNRVIGLQNEISILVRQKIILGKQTALAEKQLANREELIGKKLASGSSADDFKKNLWQLHAQSEQLESTLGQQGQEIESAKLQLRTLGYEFQEKKQQAEQALSQLQQNIVQLQSRRAQIVRADKSGTITGLQVFEGQTVNPNALLATLLPSDMTLEANILIPSQAIGFVAIGQEVNIRYNAYPYQKFGIYKGKIKKISRHVLMPQELSNSPSSALTMVNGSAEPSYQVTVSLSKQTVTAFGKKLPLKPGVQLEADIQLSARTLMEWLLEPLYSLKGRI